MPRQKKSFPDIQAEVSQMAVHESLLPVCLQVGRQKRPAERMHTSLTDSVQENINQGTFRAIPRASAGPEQERVKFPSYMA